MDIKAKVCSECGKPLAGCLTGQTEQGVCSGRCWAELFGEVDCGYDNEEDQIDEEEE